MHNRLLVILAGVSVLLLAAVIPALRQPAEYWPCGHQVHFSDRLPSYLRLLKRHRYCRSMRLASELRPSTNLVELRTEGILPPGLLYVPFMTYSVRGTNWTISVAKQAPFAGYYLGTSTNLLFNPDRWPTADDVNLERMPASRPSR